MSRTSLDILVLSDLHYIHAADATCPIPERRCHLGPSLVRAAHRQLHKTGIEPGLLVLLGDLVDDGVAKGAGEDLASVAQAAQQTGLPTLAVPGNHDGDIDRFVHLFRCAPGLYEIAGYGFLVFHDSIAADDVTTRPAEGLALPGRIAHERPDLPLVALQHNPLHPHVEADYPYMLTNAEEIIRGYDEAGVILSLSGHYHKGQPAHSAGDVICYTLPAACEVPFRYARIRLRGREVEVWERALGTMDAGKDILADEWQTTNDE
jgi:predicted MPP superfamily phosphohydrolase